MRALCLLVLAVLLLAPSRASAQESPARARPLRVVLDPGHGGSDSGSIGVGGEREASITLDVVRRVVRLLEGDPVRLTLTRSGPQLVGLDERVALSNRARPDLFLSIHCNWSRTPRSGGLAVFVGPAPGADPLQQRRDRVQRAWAFAFKRAVLEALRAVVGPLRDRGVQRERFRVLRNAAVPAVLVEMPYLSNPTQSAWYAREDVRDAIAGALARVLREFTPPRPGRQ